MPLTTSHEKPLIVSTKYLSTFGAFRASFCCQFRSPCGITLTQLAQSCRRAGPCCVRFNSQCVIHRNQREETKKSERNDWAKYTHKRRDHKFGTHVCASGSGCLTAERFDIFRMVHVHFGEYPQKFEREKEMSKRDRNRCRRFLFTALHTHERTNERARTSHNAGTAA